MNREDCLKLMMMNKPLAIAYKPFRSMNANTSKERSYYTQGHQFVARVLLAVWLLASVSPEGTLAAPKRQMVPATTISPGDPSLASVPPLPGGILQLPPDAPGAFWGDSVASSPSIDAALQERMGQEVATDEGSDLLRTSPKVSPVSEHFSFEARGGENVHFHYQMGQWSAEVSSHIGAFSRRAVLPVVCSQGTDVASSLEVLSKYPSWYSQRHIHVLDRNVCPTLGEVVYVGELGLKGGGEGGEASGSGAPKDAAPGQRKLNYGYSIRAVEQYMSQEEAPQSTIALVAAFNNTEDTQKQDTLARWIRGYVDWFKVQPVSVIVEEEILEPYQCLAHLKPTTEVQRRLLRSYFSSLAGRLEESMDGFQEKPLIAALGHGLRHLPPAVFGSDPAPLTTLASQLLDKLDPQKCIFAQANYPTHGPRLDALYQALLLIQEKDPSSWVSLQAGRPYQQFKSGLEAIQGARESCYPIQYHCKILLQSLCDLEQNSVLARTHDYFTRARQLTTGLFHLYKGVRAAATLDVDIESLQTACESLRAAFESARVDREAWYEWHQLLRGSCLRVLQDDTHYPAFEQDCQELIAKQLPGGLGTKALCYGFVLQLRQLAMFGPTALVREGSLSWLKDLSKRKPWSSDGDLMKGLLDSLASVCVKGKNETEQRGGMAALEQLTQSVPSTPGCYPLLLWLQNLVSSHSPSLADKFFQPFIQTAIYQWLGGRGRSLEEKLDQLQSELPHRPSALPGNQEDGLWRIIEKKIRKEMTELSTAPMQRKEARELLESYYQGQEHFRQVPSFFLENTATLMKDVQCHLMFLEQTKEQRPEVPIGAEAAASSQEGQEQSSEVQSAADSQEDKENQNTEQRPEVPIEAEAAASSQEDKENQIAEQRPEMPSEAEAATSSQEGKENQVMAVHERTEWKKRTIALQDLFTKRRLKPDGPIEEISKVLLIGEAGTGKTTLSRKLAYDWARRAWGEEFTAVYLLPVRALQENQYNGATPQTAPTLATAIVRECFPAKRWESNEDFERLRTQVWGELKQPTTLVILDGLDERLGACKQLLSEAQDKAACYKLLMLSRPYGVVHERQMVGLEVEHQGFNDEQVDTYVQDYFRQLDKPASTSTELLTFIKKYPAPKAISHIPVNLGILCALWLTDSDGVRAATMQGSLPGLYRRLTSHIWERFLARWHPNDPQAQQSANEQWRPKVFAALGKVALGSLEQGLVQISDDQVLISGERVRDILEESGIRLELLKASGFLFLRSAGREQYQFPHLTFQEYFAGRALAERFLSKDEDDQERISDFFSEHKYESQYGRTFSFMAGEVSRKKGAKGIKRLLSLLGEGDQEGVRLQHLLLQLRVIHEWLCIASEQEAKKGMAELEQKFQVMASLKEWFGKGLEQVRIAGSYDPASPGGRLLGLLTESLQVFRSVLRQAPGVLDMLQQYAKYKEADVLGGYPVRQAAVETLGQVISAVPGESDAILKTLRKAAKDKNSNVREAASKFLDPSMDLVAASASNLSAPQSNPQRFTGLFKSETNQIEQTLHTYKLGKAIWERYYGAVGEEPALPTHIDIEAMMNSACPFWPGNKVRDTHLLVLIPSHVGGKPLTLDYLGELINSPKGEGYGTKYDHYAGDVRAAIGNQSLGSSYWVLMTRGVLPGSRRQSYQDQCALVASRAKDLAYEVPGALEAAVVMLLHHVRSGERLYGDTPLTYTRCREEVENKHLVVGGFSSGGLNVNYDYNDVGVTALRKFDPAVIDASVWARYYGSVGSAPSLPLGIDQVMDSPCPFWRGKQVRDTHLLVLIPSHVGGKALTLDYLGELIQSPKGGGHGTKYEYYWDEAHAAIGNQSPVSSYWVLMTRDVLEGSRNKSYQNQCAFVENHANRTGLAYAVPGALEAAVVMLLHHVRSGERLYSSNPFTYTRCQEKVQNFQLAVGGFSSGGLFVNYDFYEYYSGVAGLRKF